jgi:hypothetical protein
LLAPSSLALLSFIRPLVRTIRYCIHGIPITNFLTNATPPTPDAPPPAPSQWIPLPTHLTQTFSNWDTSTISWLIRFAHHLPPYLRVADPDIDPSILLHVNTTSPFPLLKIAHRRLITRHYKTRLIAISWLWKILGRINAASTVSSTGFQPSSRST